MKRALVFGGGGSKGAYEIGVWKALNELGQSFDIVTGTSIGALIGALYVQQEYEKAYVLWNTLTIDDIMSNGVNLDKDIELIMSQKGKYVEFLSSYMHHKGADIAPFMKMIDDMFDADKFFASPIDYGCMCVNFSKLAANPVVKHELTKENVKDYILASASCFPAFPMKVIGEERYIDGGYYDNVPISLARSLGAEEIVAVDLKSVGKNQLHEPQKDTIYIEPFVPLGSFLLFDRARIQRNMELGYQDTMKKFNQYIGYIYTFDKQDDEMIQIFEERAEIALLHMDEILNRDQMNRLVEKVVIHKITENLKDYKAYPRPFLAIIEQIAFTFGIHDIGIQKFEDFIQQLFDIANQHRISFTKIGDDFGSILDSFASIKDSSKLDVICYIYQYLQQEHTDRVKELQAMSVVLNDSFMKAYVLFALNLQQPHTNQE